MMGTKCPGRRNILCSGQKQTSSNPLFRAIRALLNVKLHVRSHYPSDYHKQRFLAYDARRIL